MVEQTRAVANVYPCLPVFDVPAGVAELVTGEPAPALEASRVLCLYYMGISLFDDVMDHDLGADWSEYTPEQLSCAALAMTGALPLLALSQASASLPETRSRVRALGQALSDASAGQFLDIGGLRVDDTSIDACEKIVELKTGSTGALAASLAASMVGARPEEESRLANIGFNLYCAMQIISDIQDVWSKPISRDLANGIVTPPIAWFLETADVESRAVFLSLFRARSESFAEHQRMRALLEEGGSLRYALCRAELYRRQAIETLNQSDQGDALLFDYMLDAAYLGELPA
jgi:geranylgeranyl pyrophosphate synthase